MKQLVYSQFKKRRHNKGHVVKEQGTFIGPFNYLIAIVLTFEVSILILILEFIDVGGQTYIYKGQPLKCLSHSCQKDLPYQ